MHDIHVLYIVSSTVIWRIINRVCDLNSLLKDCSFTREFLIILILFPILLAEKCDEKHGENKKNS